MINYFIMILKKKFVKSHLFMILTEQFLIVQATHLSMTLDMFKFMSTDQTIIRRVIYVIQTIIRNTLRPIGVQSSIYTKVKKKNEVSL